MTKVTKTTNPLPFEALEPKRFEDLVRQIAYSFRNWKTLESTGVSGNDKGIDIRGVEVQTITNTTPVDEGSENEDPTYIDLERNERIWVFQCKREKSITPANVGKILEDFFRQNKEAPYGYILAAACNFSSKSREVFRFELKQKGVEEFFLWGKTDLEDMLYRPKNDHLLFAYFGLSLQTKKRSIKSAISSNFSIKRKLIRIIGSVKHEINIWVMLRDPNDLSYPYYPVPPNGGGRWGYSNCIGHIFPETLTFKRKVCLAYLSPDKKSYDTFDDLNLQYRSAKIAYGGPNNYSEKDKKEYNYRKYWNENVPPESRAYLVTYTYLKYESILLVDEFGDHHNEGPHLLVSVEGGVPWDFEHSEIISDMSSETILMENLVRVEHLPKKMILEDRPIETMETLRKKLEDMKNQP